RRPGAARLLRLGTDPDHPRPAHVAVDPRDRLRRPAQPDPGHGRPGSHRPAQGGPRRRRHGRPRRRRLLQGRPRGQGGAGPAPNHRADVTATPAPPSRYAAGPPVTVPGPGGDVVLSAPRVVPAPALGGHYQVRPGDRLDLMAQAALADSTRWW